jgi:hypothetical protein
VPNCSGVKPSRGCSADLEKREDRAENRDDCDRQHRIIVFGPHRARHAHDCGRTADAAAAGREQRERMRRTLSSRADKEIHRDHDGHHEHRRHEAVQARAHEQHQIQLEAEQDDARPQELIRDEWRAAARGHRDRARELERHAESSASTRCPTSFSPGSCAA